MANIGEICTRTVVVATPDTTTAAAAQLMREYHVGTLVICEEANGARRVPVGIVTDRDLVVEVLAPGLRADTITVGDIMEPTLATSREAEGILETVEVMRQKGVRRLPVVGGDRRLIGIVATDDILDALAEQLSDLARIAARGHAREMAARK